MGIVSALASVSSSPPNATRGDQIDYWCHIQTDRQIVRLGEHPHDHTDSMHPKLSKITSHFRHSLLSILPYGQSGNSPTIPRTPARAQPRREARQKGERETESQREKERERWAEVKGREAGVLKMKR